VSVGGKSNRMAGERRKVARKIVDRPSAAPRFPLWMMGKTRTQARGSRRNLMYAGYGDDGECEDDNERVRFRLV
jgi:hypothetical protein